MILAKLTFGPRLQQSKEELEDAAEGYLGELIISGQIDDQYFLTWTQGSLNAHVMLGGSNAYLRRHHTPRGLKKLEAVTLAFGAAPSWEILDDEVKQKVPSWKKAPFLYLFTHLFDEDSSVCRGDGKRSIPSYVLPLTPEEKESLYGWQRSYRTHDRLWIDSGTLEVPAYRQLADPQSALSEEGRALCQQLETATGIPTYYYLMRYWRPVDLQTEKKRPCPGCGKAWYIRNDQPKSTKFWEFDFQCHPCRLVTHIGVSTDGGRHAKIGEFKSGVG
jgi:predicted  nucleic acid-binding Zn ribbon protein